MEPVTVIAPIAALGVIVLTIVGCYSLGFVAGISMFLLLMLLSAFVATLPVAAILSIALVCRGVYWLFGGGRPAPVQTHTVVQLVYHDPATGQYRPVASSKDATPL